MKHFFALVFLLAFGSAHSQETTLNPGATGGNLALASVVVIAPGDYVGVGILTGTGAVMLRWNSGGIVWSKSFGPTLSRLWEAKLLANGEILIVGERRVSGSLTRGYMARVTQTGGVVWAKLWEVGSYPLNFLRCAEASDGTLYALGSIRWGSFADWRGILVHAASNGVPLSLKMQPTMSNSYSATGALFVIGTEPIVFGTQGIGATSDPAVWKFDAAGNELLHRSFGDPARQDISYAAAESGGNFTLSTSIWDGSVNKIGIITLSSSLNVGSSAREYSLPSGSLQSGRVILDSSGTYVVSERFVAGLATSSAFKLVGGVPVWVRTLLTHANVTAPPFFDGGLLATSSDDGVLPLADDVTISVIDRTTGVPVVNTCESSTTFSITNAMYAGLVTTTYPISAWTNLTYFVSSMTTLTTIPLLFADCEQVVLPEELLSFTAEPVGARVQLSWRTASEIGSDYFGLERSVDGIAFEEIGRVTAAHESQSEIAYEAFDDAPFVGMSFYRLAMTDLDGSVRYSDVVAVNRGDTSLSWTIYDLLGRVIARGEGSPLVLSDASYILRFGDGTVRRVNMMR